MNQLDREILITALAAAITRHAVYEGTEINDGYARDQAEMFIDGHRDGRISDRTFSCAMLLRTIMRD